VTVNYRRLQFAGNCFIGIFLAAAFTFFGYKAANENLHALIFFFPLAVLFTLLLLWISGRTRRRLADSAHERYEDGQPPVGE
jgi:NADH:ubiquinone oxidoreductase subunit 3 (subunit A)